MQNHLSANQQARLIALAARVGRSPDDVWQEALALWEARHAEEAKPDRGPAEAAARIRELRRGNMLPPSETIENLIKFGRA